MVRRFASDLMELTALVLFLGTVLIWAQVLSG
jgi:hypothetical protein